MFPSSGLFADIICPLSKRGLCERPHCLYRHATNSRDMFGASCNVKTSLADFTGVQNGFPVANCGAPVNDETKDDCLQELERINKEIETVRHEVEQEQRRLSHYQTVLVDASNTSPDFPLSKAEIAVKNVDGSSYGLLPGTNIAKTYSQVRKYVVDNSKPRTDLEYDPLSNFSAGFWASSSSGKEQKVKNGQCLKRARSAVPCDLKKPVTYQTKLSQPPSPDSFDDSNDDDVLIIEIPPSPDKKRGRVQKPFISVTDKFVQDKVVELKRVKTVPVLPHSPVQEKRVYSNCSVVDLSGCSEDLERESQKSTQCKATEPVVEKSPEPASPPATTDQQDLNWNDLVEREENFFKVELTQCEQPHSVEKMNPLQPDNFPPKNILVHKPTAANSPCRQHLEQAKATEPPAQNRAGNQWSCTKCVQSMLPRSQKASSNSTRLMQGVALSKSYLKPAEPVSGFSQCQAQETSLTSMAESSFASTEQLLKKTDIYEVIISSDEEEEHNYSEIELSDSDPMEECYRIFMEANNEEKRSDEQSDVSVVAINVEKPEFNFKPQALPEKKRVAHEVKHTEQPVAKSRPQPQVLVPLRGPALSGFASQSSINSNIQRVQQRASMLTASVKGGQACQRRQEVQCESYTPAQIPKNLQPAPVQNAYTNYIPLRTAVIDMGNNLHLILPEGTFPLSVSSCPSQVTSVLTPISQVQMSAVTVRPTCCSPAVTPVQRYRATAPVVIPVQARKPSLNSAFQPALSSASSSPAPQTATVKPVPAKRKLKQQSEAAVKDKVPHDIRQRYVNMFTEEFLKTTTNVNDAFEKALAEERTVYNRSVNKLKYLSVAVNALKRLKNQSALPAKKEDVVNSHRFKGKIPLNPKSLKGNDMQLYESLKDYILTEERLIESNYPVKHPEKPGCAVLYDNKKSNTDPLKRICCRCGATYSVSPTGKHTRKEECTYHYGKGVKNKVPGGVETRYSCCEGVMGAPGCQVFKLHVHDSLSLEGFVSTASRHPSDTSCPGVYSLDCEMCYTVHGLELSRVTLVNSSLQVIYDTFVRPDNEVIDYNTRFSGICEEDVKENHTSLREVQDTLLSFISANTILIGHSLDTDLCALKLLHGMVVDTSVVFPHRLGPPNKLTLNNLTAEYLRRIIQESVCGHDTAEDATACMELMLWKVKEDGKLKK